MDLFGSIKVMPIDKFHAFNRIIVQMQKQKIVLILCVIAAVGLGFMLWLKPFRKEAPPWHALFPAWIEYGIPPESTMLVTAPTLGNDAELLQEIIAAAKESGIAEPLSFQDMLYLEDPSYYHYAVIRETAENGKGYDIRLFAFTNEDVSKVYLAWISATAYIDKEEIIFPATATPAEVTQCMNDYLSGS